MISVHDIERVGKQLAGLREELRRCMSKVDANRNGGHLLDNTVRESLQIARSLRKVEARLKDFKARRAEARNAREPAAPVLAPQPAEAA